MRKTIIYKLFFFITIFVYTSCQSKNEIENLTISKQKVADYYESGKYENDLRKALKPAYEVLRNPIDTENPAIVFDVDETILSNYEYIKSIDFGYKRDLWDEYLFKGTAAPIEETVKFYRSALEKNISVIFLTARPTTSCTHTFNNLIEVGVEKFDTLICRPEEFEKIPSAEFKEHERMLLAKSGYNIILCVGDQKSDIDGKFTGTKIKLPNKIYITE